jgi:hypothetical protein
MQPERIADLLYKTTVNPKKDFYRNLYYQKFSDTVEKAQFEILDFFKNAEKNIPTMKLEPISK